MATLQADVLAGLGSPRSWEVLSWEMGVRCPQTCEDIRLTCLQNVGRDGENKFAESDELITCHQGGSVVQCQKRSRVCGHKDEQKSEPSTLVFILGKVLAVLVPPTSPYNTRPTPWNLQILHFVILSTCSNFLSFSFVSLSVNKVARRLGSPWSSAHYYKGCVQNSCSVGLAMPRTLYFNYAGNRAPVCTEVHLLASHRFA